MIKALISILKQTFNLSGYKITAIDNDYKLSKFNSDLHQFESQFTYPLSSTERFKIIHGGMNQNSYLDFFKSLGLTKFFIVQTNDGNFKEEIVGAACAVLRKIREKSGAFKKVWYLCDLKIVPKHQGKNLPLLLFLRMLLCSFRSTKWYALSMNSHYEKNKLASYLK